MLHRRPPGRRGKERVNGSASSSRVGPNEPRPGRAPRGHLGAPLCFALEGWCRQRPEVRPFLSAMK